MPEPDKDGREVTMNDLAAILEEMLSWQKISSFEKVKDLLVSTLDTPEKRMVYQLSDGRTVRDIGVACGVGAGTVSTYWKRWFRIGLMKKVAVRGGGERHFRSFDLEDFGIDVPKIPDKSGLKEPGEAGPAAPLGGDAQ
jgi:hypothetical protein